MRATDTGGPVGETEHVASAWNAFDLLCALPPRRHSWAKRRTCDLCLSSPAWRQMPEEIRGSSFLRMTVWGTPATWQRCILAGVVQSVVAMNLYEAELW